MLLNCIKERRWIIPNGCIKGDKEGEFIYMKGRSGMVIDYVLVDKEVRKWMEDGNRRES